MLLHVRIPHESSNAAVRDGSGGGRWDKFSKKQRPEAVYFTEYDGHVGLLW